MADGLFKRLVVAVPNGARRVLSAEMSARATGFTFLGTVLIVLMHVPCQWSSSCFSVQIAHWVKSYFSVLAVPMFFMLSGLMLGKNMTDARWYRKAVGKRMWTLLVPYLLVNTIYVPFVLYYHCRLGLGEWPSGGPGFDFYTISRLYGLTPFSMPACNAFWYVRNLLLLVLVSPVLAYFIRRSLFSAVFFVISVLLISSCALRFSTGIWSCFFYDFVNAKGVFFFTFGIFLSQWVWKFMAEVHFLPGMLFFVLGVILRGTALSYETSILSFALLILGLWSVLPAWGLPVFLAGTCFAVYAFHQLFVALLQFVHFRGDWVVLQLFICYIGPAVIVFFFQKFFPRCASIVLGGRSMRSSEQSASGTSTSACAGDCGTTRGMHDSPRERIGDTPRA